MIKAKYFKQHEFECKCGCGFDHVNPELVYKLDRARSMAKIPFIVNSGCRCPEHNTKENGSKNSAHMDGDAADIRVHNDHERAKMLIALVLAGFERIGIRKDFIHVDVRPGVASWVY
jgi:uncharacterized protein YcbK (DUF882 family)